MRHDPAHRPGLLPSIFWLGRHASAPLSPVERMKKMERLFGLAALMGFWLVGEGISHTLALPVPGSVIGLLMLFALLCLLGRVPESLAQASDGLLGYLALLFVPAGVGVMVYGDQLLASWLPVTVAVVVATLLTLTVSAGVMAALMRLKAGRS